MEVNVDLTFIIKLNGHAYKNRKEQQPIPKTMERKPPQDNKNKGPSQKIEGKNELGGSGWEAFRQLMETMPNGNLEFSWVRAHLHAQNILPAVRDQGIGRPTCVFHALCAAAEMEIRRGQAMRDPPSTSDITFDAESFVIDFEREIRLSIGEERELRLVDRREDVGLRLFRSNGVVARSADWGGEQRVRIASYRVHRYLNFLQVARFLSRGRAVVGVIPAGDELIELGAAEIYQFYPLEATYGREADTTHMVLFVGFGVQDGTGRPYLVFESSTGTGFADNGFGRIFFDQIVRERLYTLTAEAPQPPPPPRSCADPQSSSSSATSPPVPPPPPPRPEDLGNSSSSATPALPPQRPPFQGHGDPGSSSSSAGPCSDEVLDPLTIAAAIDGRPRNFHWHCY
ncbi:hypothetical protein TRIUR3_05721 [Triticum urartu]|uniref:Peptidase C1A papain C-terminal domain-containing protein n=2 Tax=Triticum urartu TaxID=4572 RepID=M7ZLB2_TRIUA|nr:hypothetical protein TRIUR3_05721 [Triticum urartu]